MNRNELTDMILNHKNALAQFEAVSTGCRDCAWVEKDTPVCRKHGPIPDDFIEQGCDEWDWDDVPF